MRPHCNSPFRFLRQLNDAPHIVKAFKGDDTHLPQRIAEYYFRSDTPIDRFIRELIDTHATSYNELLESLEVFGHIRKVLRKPHILDLCCGHGLVGTLFALLERRVHRVTLLDTRIPDSLASVLNAAIRIGPWVKDKVSVHQAEIDQAQPHLTRDTAVTAIHACGTLTDRALDLASENRSSVAVMPCCGHQKNPETPAVIYRELGVKLGVDVDRTHQLSAKGYRVIWRYLPEEITTMNRLIIGKT